jgi:HK97 family phage major capsid protein/HK97 family phage prohead protease
MDRAYALLEIKAVDTARRIVTGTATTPLPDRLGDIIEPLGVQFTNPLPLLLYHDAQKPIGRVTFDAPTAKGITFSATLPAVTEPGTLKDRVDEAWQSLKAGLLTGVSIGFRALEHAFLKEGGVHFLKTEVLELSLVAIPANASATIHTIKSLDGSHAASGVGRSYPPLPAPGATGPELTRQTSMKTASEQIADFQASRTPKADRMNVIMQKAMTEGRTLTTDESTEYDGLSADVKSYTDHITRLEAFEAIQATKAVPVADARKATGQAYVEPPKLPPGIEFARYAMCLASARGNTHQALEIAKQRYPDQARIQTVLKAAVAAGTTTDPTWAGALVPEYPNFAGDFVDFLRPMTIVGKFGVGGVPSLRRVPFNVRVGGQTSGGTGYWVGQGAPKPVTKFDFETTKLGWAKVANIAVLTEELIRFSSPAAEGLVRDALAAALIARMDIDFIDPAKALVADVSPASITNGIAALTPSGTDAAAVRTDLQTLLGTFMTGNLNPTSAVFIMPNTVALAISLMTNALGQPEFSTITMTGGTLKGIPVITSQYAVLGGSPDGNLLILVNASDIFLSDDGQVVIDVSREASLQMADDPTNSPAAGSPLAPVPTSLVSLWQTDSVGLRAHRFINWLRRRDEAVAYLENVQYSA